MSDQNDDFTTGERLARPSRQQAPQRPKPPRDPRAPKPRKPRGLIGKIFAFCVSSVYKLVFVVIIAGIVVAGGAFLYFSSGLPSIDSLKT